MRQAFAPPPPPPPPPVPLSQGTTDENLGKTGENTSAENQVPPECPRFLPFLLSLDPYTLWILSILIALFIAKEAQYPDEQDAIGSFLESIGVNIGFIATQGYYLRALQDRRKEKIDEIESEQLRDEIDDLKRTITQLQDQMLSCCPNSAYTNSESTIKDKSNSE